MGKCAKRTKAIAKEILQQVKPHGIKIIGTIVASLADAKITNDEKRKLAVDVGMAVTGAKEAVVQVVVAASVAALKQGADALAELGQAEPADLVDDPA